MPARSMVLDNVSYHNNVNGGHVWNGRYIAACHGLLLSLYRVLESWSSGLASFDSKVTVHVVGQCSFIDSIDNLSFPLMDMSQYDRRCSHETIDTKTNHQGSKYPSYPN